MFEKIFDETTDTIDHILDLNTISNCIDALQMLFLAVSRNADLYIGIMKTIAENLGLTVNDVARV